MSWLDFDPGRYPYAESETFLRWIWMVLVVLFFVLIWLYVFGGK
jgi:hypothetical protein